MSFISWYYKVVTKGRKSCGLILCLIYICLHSYHTNNILLLLFQGYTKIISYANQVGKFKVDSIIISYY